MFHLRTLGAIDLLGHDGQTLRSAVAQPKRFALLTYLTLARDAAPLRRDHLLGVFWPESSDSRARAALSQALTYLRRSLGDGVLLGEASELVGVNSAGLDSDAGLFERLKQAGRPEEALALCRGPFLPGFFLSGAPEFEQWVEQRRARLENDASALALLLAEGAAGDPERAAQWARRALEIRWEDERALRLLIDALARLGDRAAALDTYEQFAGRLQAEHELEPDAETLAALERIRLVPAIATPAKAAAPSEPHALPHPIAGSPAPEPARAPPDPARRPQLRRSLPAAVAAGLVIVAAGAAIVVEEHAGRAGPASATGSSDPGALHPPELVPNRLFVSVLDNRTGDPRLNRVGQMAADWLTQGLVHAGLDVVPQQFDTWAEGANDSTRIHRSSSDDALALARNSHSSLLVAGSYYVDGDSLRFSLDLQDVATGGIVQALPAAAAPIGSALEGVERLRQAVASAVVARTNPVISSWVDETGPATSFAAYDEFARGMEGFVHYRIVEARDHFLRAAEIDSTYALPLLWAVYAMEKVGYDSTLARLTTSRLDRLRPRMTPFEQRFLDYHLAVERADRAGILVAARRLAEAAPGTEWDYELGLALLGSNHPVEAEHVLQRMDPSRGWLKDWWGDYWGWLASAATQARDYETCIHAADELKAHGDTYAGDRMAVPCLAALGRIVELEQVMQDVRDIDAWDMAPLTLYVATSALRARGWSREADALMRRHAVPAWYAAHPPSDSVAGVWMHRRLQEWYLLIGNLPAARREHALLPKDFLNRPIYLDGEAAIAFAAGDSARVLDIIAQLLEDAATASGRKTRNAPADRYAASRWYAKLGRREEAVLILSQALETGAYLNGWYKIAPSLDDAFKPLHGYPAFERVAAAH